MEPNGDFSPRSRDLIRGVKEILVDYSDSEIFSALTRSSMDVNDAIVDLLEPENYPSRFLPPQERTTKDAVYGPEPSFEHNVANTNSNVEPQIMTSPEFSGPDLITTADSVLDAGAENSDDIIPEIMASPYFGGPDLVTGDSISVAEPNLEVNAGASYSNRNFETISSSELRGLECGTDDIETYLEEAFNFDWEHASTTSDVSTRPAEHDVDALDSNSDGEHYSAVYPIRYDRDGASASYMERKATLVAAIDATSSATYGNKRRMSKKRRIELLKSLETKADLKGAAKK